MLFIILMAFFVSPLIKEMQTGYRYREFSNAVKWTGIIITVSHPLNNNSAHIHEASLFEPQVTLRGPTEPMQWPYRPQVGNKTVGVFYLSK